MICRFAVTAALEIEKRYDSYLEQYQKEESERSPGRGIFGMGAGPGDLPCHVRFLDSMKSLLDEIAGREAEPREFREAMEFILREPVNVLREAPAVYWTLLAVHGLSLGLIGRLDSADASELYKAYKSTYPRSKRLPAQEQVLAALKERAGI